MNPVGHCYIKSSAFPCKNSNTGLTALFHSGFFHKMLSSFDSETIQACVLPS